MNEWIKRNSQAIWSVIAAVIALGPLFGWYELTAEQISGLMLVYGSVMMALRQLFSLTPVE